jgi:8-oxo-dGTP pyrophosphatase MutT (NUDIX family)
MESLRGGPGFHIPAKIPDFQIFLVAALTMKMTAFFLFQRRSHRLALSYLLIAPLSSTSMSLQAPKVTSTERIASTRWLALDTYHWTDPEGKERQWNVAARTTTTEGRADAVMIIPLLRSNDGSLDTLLVQQFRPPMKQATLEFPAGLIDAGEAVETCALRELKEETGYRGTCLKISRPVCMSPGLTNEQVHVALVDVDMNHIDNQDPKAELDEGEFVMVKRVSLKQSLEQYLDNVAEHPMPIMGLYLFAMGYELGRRCHGEEGPANEVKK